MAESEYILETVGLTKEFAGFTAVNNVSLKVRRNTIHALIGPNGAGKTTVFNLLTKFLQPSKGTILYNGKDITVTKPADVARLGLVRSFQISAVFPNLTALENVRVALQREHGESFDFWRSKSVLNRFNERARALLDDVGLSAFADIRAAGLYKTERSAFVPYLIATPILFFLGLNDLIGWPTRGFTTIAPAVLLAVGGLSLLGSGGGTLLVALLALAMLFIVSVALHGYLYHLRPAPRHLTHFYLIMSAGGVLGGLFAALFAPLLFDWVYEHPLLVLAAALLLPLPALLPWDEWLKLSPGRARAVVALFVALAMVASARMVDQWSGRLEGELLACAAVLFALGLLAIRWRLAYVTILALLMLGMGGVETLKESVGGARVRSYFGVYTVTDDAYRHQRRLAHGTTLHGLQRTDAPHELEPTTYYGHQSGVGLTLDRADSLAGPGASVGLVGLGAGTLSCYRRPGQRWTIFEIDPAMADIARDPSKFTFISQCAPDVPIVIGDARLRIAQSPPAQFDILIIDAFSSDAIPLHLLTKEAIGIYARALKPDGILLIHISNRFFDLEPVLAAEAKARRWSAAIRMDPSPDAGTPDYDFSNLTGSNWVAMTATPQRLTQLTGGVKPRTEAAKDGIWVPVEERPRFERWTDDYASTLPVLLWGHLIGNRE